MKRLIYLICLPILFWQCNQEPAPSGGFVPEVPNTASLLSYLALGDSYTIGEDVAEAERYPVQLSQAVDNEDIDLDAPTIVARTGWTTAQLQQGIAQADLEEQYDLVSLLIGVNNQFRNRSIDEYKIEFTELLDQAIDFTGDNPGRVFVLSIPDYAFTPYGQNSSNPAAISAGIDDFNVINRQITEAAGVAYFDITPISREGIDEPTLVADDGLHPSGLQYQRWVTLIKEEVRLLLEN